MRIKNLIKDRTGKQCASLRTCQDKECVSLTQKIQRTSKEHDVACQNENTAQDENPKISCRSNNKLTIPRIQS